MSNFARPLIKSNHGRNVISAFLVCCILISGVPAIAAFGPGKKPAKPLQKNLFGAEVRFAEYGGERFPSGVKLSWRTEYEKNIVGFRIWRELDGKRSEVSGTMTPGSIAKAGGIEMLAGDEYVAYDPFAAESSIYWIEAVDINSRSRWTGPVIPVTGLVSDDATDSGIAEFGARKEPLQSEFPAGFKAETQAESLAPPSFDPASDDRAIKIYVREKGLYRLDPSSLANVNYDQIRAEDWRMFNGATEIPIKIERDGAIIFFAAGIDTQQTDANVYWLVSDTQNPARISGGSQNFQANTRDGSSRVTVERRERSMRVSSVINGARENWFGSYVSTTTIDKTLELRDLMTGSGQTATVGIDLQGISNLTHQVTVKLNGTAIGSISFGAYDRHEWTTTVPVSALVEGTNTISLQATNTTSDFSLTEAFRITYPRQLRARNDRLEFVHDNNQSVKLRGFASPTVRVYDITSAQQVSETECESRLEIDGTYSVTIGGTSSPRLLLAQGDSQKFLSPAAVVRNTASNLRSQQNSAKLVIIGPADLLEGMVPLKLAREQSGMATKLVDVEDVYDEFGNGIKSAEAIKGFLQYAKLNWAVKPDYAILAGDSSADPRNYAGYGGDAANRVPTMFVDTWNIEAPSDEMLVDFNGDSIGEITIGRLPAVNRFEIDMMVEKILVAGAQPLSSVGARGVDFVSDDLLGYDFAAASRAMAATIPSSVTVNYFDRTGQDPAVLRGTIINRINNGAAIVNFFGHGSITSWTSAGILRNADAPAMFNTSQPTFFVSLACLNGDNTVFGVTGFAEAMIKREHGGAFAVWAASGWNGAFEEELMGRDLYPRIFSGMRLGDAVREVKSLYPTADMRRTFIFFGDPTQRLVTP